MMISRGVFFLLKNEILFISLERKYITSTSKVFLNMLYEQPLTPPQHKIIVAYPPQTVDSLLKLIDGRLSYLCTYYTIAFLLLQCG